MNICMIGTGYVGLVTGTCLAHKGNHVICTDIDKYKIEQLNRGEVPIYEPGLEALIKENIKNKRLEFTHKIKEAIQKSEIIYIAVGTPPCADGSADLCYVYKAANDIATALNGYKIIVDKSTVPVGTAMKIQKIIEKNRIREVGFSVISNPEFLKEGSAIKDIFEGDRIVIGVNDEKAEKIMTELYEPFNIPIYITDVVSAEMIKYAANAFLATKISFINEIANVCESVGADVTKVAEGMGADIRIGRSFLNAGLGYGGSCFPKDVKALNALAKEVNYEFKILNAVMDVNEKQKELMVQKVLDHLKGVQNPHIGVLGLAFKPNTDDVREAPALTIIRRLTEKGVKIKTYDPIAIDNVKEILTDIQYCDNAYEAFRDVDALLIITEWDEFKEIDLHKAKNLMKTPLIIDGRNIFEPYKMKSKGFQYISIGRE